ncbi:MAG: hypothetical protein WD077_11445 [Bacteroidia bacterium]
MSRKYKFHNQEGLHFISFTVLNWLGVFIKDEYKELLMDSWCYFTQTSKVLKTLEVSYPKYPAGYEKAHCHQAEGTDPNAPAGKPQGMDALDDGKG